MSKSYLFSPISRKKSYLFVVVSYGSSYQNERGVMKMGREIKIIQKEIKKAGPSIHVPRFS